MNIRGIVNGVIFTLKKHSPEILMGLGITGIVGGTVMACVSTEKAHQAIDKFNEHMEEVKAKEAEIEAPTMDDVKTIQKQKTACYRKMIFDVAKAYAPAVLIETVGIGCILGSHHIMKNRNLALATAYTTLGNSFKFYRDNVKEKYGEEEDANLMLGKTEGTVTTFDEKGNEIDKKKEIMDTDSSLLMNPYSFFYQAGVTGWQKDPLYSRQNLSLILDSLTRDLRQHGLLTLNEVLKAFDVELRKDGYQVGWRYKEDETFENDFIQMLNSKREATRRYLNGDESIVLLEPNCKPLYI